MNTKVYITGPLRGLNKSATKKNRHNLSLACRKALLTENTPVCPMLQSEDWDLDPRLPNSDDWWVKNYFVEFMKDCEEFVYVPEPIGMKSHIVEMEKDLWRTIGTGEFISSDVVIKTLLSKGGE